MAKKGAGTKKHPAEILDDNGTLIATSAGVPGAVAQGADEDEVPAEGEKRDRPERS